MPVSALPDLSGHPLAGLTAAELDEVLARLFPGQPPVPVAAFNSAI